MFHEMFHGAPRIVQSLCGVALYAGLASCSSTDPQSTTATAGGQASAVENAGANNAGAGGNAQSGSAGASSADAGESVGGAAGSGGANTIPSLDASVSDASTTDAAAPQHDAADAASCDVGCMPLSTGGIGQCANDEVEWICEGNHDLAAFNANCETVPVNSIRYCCPESFLAQCQ